MTSEDEPSLDEILETFRTKLTPVTRPQRPPLPPLPYGDLVDVSFGDEPTFDEPTTDGLTAYQRNVLNGELTLQDLTDLFDEAVHKLSYNNTFASVDAKIKRSPGWRAGKGFNFRTYEEDDWLGGRREWTRNGARSMKLQHRFHMNMDKKDYGFSRRIDCIYIGADERLHVQRSPSEGNDGFEELEAYVFGLLSQDIKALLVRANEKEAEKSAPIAKVTGRNSGEQGLA